MSVEDMNRMSQGNLDDDDDSNDTAAMIALGHLRNRAALNADLRRISSSSRRDLYDNLGQAIDDGHDEDDDDDMDESILPPGFLSGGNSLNDDSSAAFEDDPFVRYLRQSNLAPAPPRRRAGSIRYPVESLWDDEVMHDLDMFDGDLDEEDEDEDDEDGDGEGQDALDLLNDMVPSSVWPGFLAERPLNGSTPPGPSPLRTSFFPSYVRSPSPTPSLGSSALYSATAPTSFLQPGVLFVGQQRFDNQHKKRNSVRLRRLSQNRPYPSTSTASREPQLPPHSPYHSPSLASLLSPSVRTILDASAAGRELLGSLQRDTVPSSMVQTAYSIERGGMGDGTRRVDAMDVWDSVSMLTRAGAGGRALQVRELVSQDGLISSPISAAEAAAAAKAEDEERWDVRVSWYRELLLRHGNVRAPDARSSLSSQVVLHTYSQADHTITGLMHALGVPNSSAQVTTYFSGTILDVAVDGLFGATVREGGKLQQAAATAQDAEHWSKLGPFKNITTKEELLRRKNDTRWLKEVTEGWILMNWQERDFVNVTRASRVRSFALFAWLLMILRPISQLPKAPSPSQASTRSLWIAPQVPSRVSLLLCGFPTSSWAQTDVLAPFRTLQRSQLLAVAAPLSRTSMPCRLLLSRHVRASLDISLRITSHRLPLSSSFLSLVAFAVVSFVVSPIHALCRITLASRLRKLLLCNCTLLFLRHLGLQSSSPPRCRAAKCEGLRCALPRFTS